MHSSGKSGQQLERKSFNSSAGTLGRDWGGQKGQGHPARGRVVVLVVPAHAGTGLIFAFCPLERLFWGEGACPGVHLQSKEL